jgi:hypothetical protein
MFSSSYSNFSIAWSDYVEKEADRRVRANQSAVSSVREAAKSELTPTGHGLARFTRTHPKDRQVLADAIAAGATVIVTEDVDDFDESELIAADLAAANPDLFLAECVTTAAYASAVRQMSTRMSSPARTAEQLHARIGRQHPLAVAAHKQAFDSKPAIAVNRPPAVVYRGNRCLRCLQAGVFVTLGVCEPCRAA